MSYIEVTGKTEEEAIARALNQLDLERDDVTIELLERAKSGFLGLGAAPARIRVCYQGEATTSAPTKQEKTPSAENLVPSVQGQPVQKQPEDVVSKGSLPQEEEDEIALRIRNFLTGLLQHLQSPASLRISLSEKGRYLVVIEGEKLGQLIGRRGETLDAIQQLTGYAVNRNNDKGRIRIQMDVEGYRSKREQTLEALAVKVAGKVIKYHRSVTLEPMNAYERHVIHTALQEMDQVNTYSIGSEPNRRVVVAFDREKIGTKVSK